ALDGWPVEMSDTAGWRAAAEPVESEGIARAQAAVREADLCLWLLDASTAPQFPPDIGVLLLLVVNKIDLPPAWDVESVPDAMRVSAKTGTGIAELCAVIGRRLVPDPPPPGAPVPFSPQLLGALAQARESPSRETIADLGG